MTAPIVEDVGLIVSGIRDGSWVDAALGGFGASLDTLALAIDPVGTLAAWGVAWLIEHVRPLQEALDWLAGDASEIAAHAAQWANMAGFVDGVRRELADRVEIDLTGWSGAAGSAYRAHVDEHLTVLQGLGVAAGGVSSAVEGAGLVVALTRGIVSDLIAQFVATLAVRLPQWLAMEGLTVGVATPLVVSQVAALVARWVNKIQGYVRGLLNSLRRLLPRTDSLRVALERLLMVAKRLAGSVPTGHPKAASSRSKDRPPGEGGASGTTSPSSPPDPGRKPRGDRTEAHPARIADRGLRRENEAADALAKHGFDVEQNPPGKPNGKKPDYKIEGEYFDCYAPRTDNVDNLRKQMSKKVSDDQADRLVLNLEDTPCTMEEIADVLERRPINGLKEIVVVLGGQVIPFYSAGR